MAGLVVNFAAARRKLVQALASIGQLQAGG